jgi:hypothetical protein
VGINTKQPKEIGVKEIPLTQGKVAIVDDADYERVSQFKWCAMKGRNGFYAASHISGNNNRLRLMHRFILGAPTGMQVDHKDRNGLNNTRDNLRLATPTQNRANSPKPINRTAPYMGIQRFPRRRKWAARIRTDGKPTWLGFFDEPDGGQREIWRVRPVELSSVVIMQAGTNG